MNYSPFVDSKGNPLELTKIRFSHLAQLKEVDEGYKIEYKRSFDQSVKNKIPAIITSFANSEGGWLIIGIDDDTHGIIGIPKKRGDYNQTISQLLKEKTSPIPTFDSKFLRNPQNKEEGVLIIEVYEGTFPPYVSNGTIYIRNGSSKEPIKSERATIDHLYQKARLFQEEISQFCKRDIYFPNNTFTQGIGRITYPICNVYLINIRKSPKYRLKSREDFENLKTEVTNEKHSNLLQNMQHTFNSVVFRHQALDPSTPSITPTIEIFSDFSAKLHVPLGFTSNSERETAINNLKNSGLICKDDIKICDGVDSFNCIFGLLYLITKVYDHYNIPIRDMAVCFEMENSDNTVLYFNGNIFLDQAKSNGLCYCNRIESKSKVIFLKDSNVPNYQAVASSLAFDFFLAEFGFDPNYAEEMIFQANKEKYPDMQK